MLICLLCSFDVYNVFINSVIKGQNTMLSFKEMFSFYTSIVISTVLICSYFSLLPFLLNGQTLGMKFFRIRILNEAGEKASLKRKCIFL